ncbi:MAG: ABC transporter ATP-binding protein [Pseudolysinimonas sp.]
MTPNSTAATTVGAPARAEDAAIVCTDLVRIFRSEGIEVQALQGLNLRVADGELVAIVGASGSGKSTLLGILSGLDAPTAGTARVAGRTIGTLTPAQRVDYLRTGVGFIWQQTSRNLLPYLSIAENIALPMLLARVAKQQRAARLDELLGLLELDADADRSPAELSGGELQRASIAVALANRPQVLLADEPTGELDEAASVQVLEAMRAVNRELGTTTLIVTHDATVSEHVGRTVQIRDGRTSTEVLRRPANVGGADPATGGAIFERAQTFTVIDAQGRLQLPADYVRNLSLHDRVRLALRDDHVRVSPGDGTTSEEAPHE